MKPGQDNQPSVPMPLEVRLTEETIKYLDGRMRASVAEGIRDAMTKDNARSFWAAGLDVLREEAQDHAGRFVVGSIRALAGKLLMFLILGGIVYAIGGWAALGRLWAILFHDVTGG